MDGNRQTLYDHPAFVNNCQREWGQAVLTFDNHVSFSQGDTPIVTLRNFWETEDGFVWSQGKWCDITFDFNWAGTLPVGYAELMLDLDVFKMPDHLPGQNVFTYLNGLRIGSTFVERRMTVINEFDSKMLRKTDNVITLDTPDSCVPASFGMADVRQLGLQLFSLQIRKGV